MAQPQQQQGRRVLQVAPPGKGDGEAFPTVQAAVDAVPLGNRARVVIRLAPGVYREPVYVAKTKSFITLAGAAGGPEATVVSWDNTATRIKHSQVLFPPPPAPCPCSTECSPREELPCLRALRLPMSLIEHMNINISSTA